MTISHRIAVIGDTHDAETGRDVVLKLLQPVLANIDAILHTGDVNTEDFLGDLTAIAPVTAVRSEMDPDVPPHLTAGPRTLELGGCRIVLHRAIGSDDFVERDDADLVVHGATHSPGVRTAGRTYYLDPGAPVFTPTPTGAIVEIEDGRPRITIVPLA